MSRFHKRRRRPIRKSAVGVTRVMKGVKRAAGITEDARPLRTPANARQRAVQRAGHYRALMQLLRLLARLR